MVSFLVCRMAEPTDSTKVALRVELKALSRVDLTVAEEAVWMVEVLAVLLAEQLVGLVVEMKELTLLEKMES